MSRGYTLLGVLVALALVFSLALGLRGVYAPPAGAQEPPAEATGEAEPAQEVPQEVLDQLGPLPDLNQVLERARSQDLALQVQGVMELGQHYMPPRQPRNLQEIEEILREATLQGATSGIRSAAVNALASRPDRNGEILLRATGDADIEVRTAAVGALRYAPPSPETDRRLEVLSRSADTALAVQAVDVLMQRYGARGVAGIGPLVGQLGNMQGDASAKASLILHQMVRRHEPPVQEVVPALGQALLTSPNAQQRHAAATVLALVCAGRFPKQEAYVKATEVDIRIERETRDPDLRGLEPLMHAVLNDPAPLVREIAAQGLGYLGDARAVPALTRALESDPAGEVRARAGAALVLLPGEQALEALRTAVSRDASPRARLFAVEALGWSEDPRAPSALVVATRDSDAEVRRLAAAELGRLRAAEGVEALVELVYDPVEEVRWAAVVALDKLRARAAEAALVYATRDPSVLVSRSAETALRRLGITRRAENYLQTS